MTALRPRAPYELSTADEILRLKRVSTASMKNSGGRGTSGENVCGRVDGFGSAGAVGGVGSAFACWVLCNTAGAPL